MNRVVCSRRTRHLPTFAVIRVEKGIRLRVWTRAPRSGQPHHPRGAQPAPGLVDFERPAAVAPGAA